MRVLVFAGFYYPAKNAGGPVVSIDAICTLLHERIEFYVVALDHDLGSKRRFQDIKPGWNKRDNCSVLYLSEQDMNEKTFARLIGEINPDLLYLQSLFDYKTVIPALKCSRDQGLPVLLAPRGQLCRNAFRKKIRKFAYLLFYRGLFSRSNVFYQYTSDEEFTAFLRYLPVNRDRIIELANIPNIKVEPPKKSPKVSGQLKVVFLSRIHNKKNLIGAIKLLHHVKGEVVFNIFGSLEDEGYWSRCLEEISKLPPNITVEYQGSVDYDSVFSVFSRHDVFLFPTYSENYGHVIAESLLSGCPVLLSDQTPWSGVTDAGVGWVYSLDDNDGFVNTLNELVLWGAEEYHTMSALCSNFVLDRLNIETLSKQYYECFEKLQTLKNTDAKM